MEQLSSLRRLWLTKLVVLGTCQLSIKTTGSWLAPMVVPFGNVRSFVGSPSQKPKRKISCLLTDANESFLQSSLKASGSWSYHTGP